MNHVPSLFRQSNELAFTLTQIAEADGELSPALEEQLTLTSQNLAGRATWLIELMQQAEANMQLADEKARQVADFKKANERIVKQIKDRLQVAAEVFGPIEAGTYKVSLRKSKAVVIDDASLIPDELRAAIIVPLQGNPDKKAILKHIEQGHAVPGARVVENQNIQIK